MKGITGHRVLDAYANAALSRVGSARGQAQGAQGVPSLAGQEAAQVTISDGARLLAQGQASDPARISSLQDKVALGPAAFDTNIVAQRLVSELTG